MKTNELRIGNLVNYKYSESDFVRVTGITEDGDVFVDEVTADYVDITDLEPLPLTEEWLLKFGFNKGMAGYYVLEFKKDMKFDFSLKDSKISVNCWYFIDHLDIKYVHQLQNLYFTLTNQELKLIKP